MKPISVRSLDSARDFDASHGFAEQEETMELRTPHTFGKTVEMPYAEAEKRVREELAKEGFGVLTVIDARKKIAEKLQK